METTNVTNVNLIVETAITDIAGGKSEYKSGLARAVLDEMSKATHGDAAAETVFHAIYKAAIRNAIFNTREAEKMREQQGTIFKPRYYDISFYGFFQNIMDKICWNIRRGTVVRHNVDELEELLAGGNGLDFANDIGDEQEFDATTSEMIRSEVEHVYSLLFRTQSKLGAKLKIRSDDALYLFAPSTLVGDEWIQQIKTNDWDEALSYMAEIAKELAASSQVDESDLDETFSLEDDPRQPSQERLEALQANLSSKRTIKRNAKGKAA